MSGANELMLYSGTKSTTRVWFGTHLLWDPLTPTCICKQCYHWFRKWLGAVYVPVIIYVNTEVWLTELILEKCQLNTTLALMKIPLKKLTTEIGFFLKQSFSNCDITKFHQLVLLSNCKNTQKDILSLGGYIILGTWKNTHMCLESTCNQYLRWNWNLRNDTQLAFVSQIQNRKISSKVYFWTQSLIMRDINSKLPTMGHQATGHYLQQKWARSLMQWSIRKPCWFQIATFFLLPNISYRKPCLCQNCG